MLERLKDVSVREYGASFLMKEVSGDIIELLKENFDEWKEIFVFAAMRLIFSRETPKALHVEAPSPLPLAP